MPYLPTCRLTLLVCCLGVSVFGQVPPAVQRYCAGCHNGKTPAPGLALTTRPDQAPADWEKAVRKLRTRQMPPPGLPKPDEATYNALIATLEDSLDRAALAKPNPGRTDTFRRLNRTEYRNAVRDLLGLDIDVAALLPADETSHGFDNVTVGELSPSLLEKYLAASHKISRAAVGTALRSPGGDTIFLPPDLTQEDTLPGLPFGTRGGTTVTYNFPLNGEYEIQLRLARDRDERVEGLLDTHDLELSIDGRRVQTYAIKPPARGAPHHQVDKDLNLRTTVPAGPHEITATFLKRTAALLETERQPYAARFNADRHPRMQPALYSVSIIGPYGSAAAGDTPSRRRIFTCLPPPQTEETACAKQILTALTRRAYRRAVTDADVAALLRFYQEGRSSGSFDAGIEMALRALLVSPQFLFRIERDPAGLPAATPYRLSGTELATRLSFFLWNSIPDDTLLNLAIQGHLQKPAVLSAQVRRMLKDPRSRSLVTNFASQWLYLRNLDGSNPDPRLYPDFDDNLRQALRQETELFVESIVCEDRNVLDLLRARYTYLNERLARHYGIPNVYGTHFRRINLPADSVRGGLLSQGSILTVTSYATRTSPVIRGKWILTNILGAPPAPPPPNVPPLKEKTTLGKDLSIRDQMAAHRNNPACSSCHNLMDPVGFALENFDAVGRWRTRDGTLPVDASGNFPDGTKFAQAAGLQKAILDRPELFVHALGEKLLVYALGRGAEPYDAPALRKIVREAQREDYRFSSLILGTVNSTPFQMRRSQ